MGGLLFSRADSMGHFLWSSGEGRRLSCFGQVFFRAHALDLAIGSYLAGWFALAGVFGFCRSPRWPEGIPDFETD